MRLLHTTELRFEEFFDDRIPQYAILSHRWGDNEVSYQDFLSGKNKDGSGYAKIIAFCNVAAADSTTYGNLRVGLSRRGRFDWAWIDTCCIDKSSSAELSEAINSMYRWYANSIVCYAYLSDVVMDTDQNQTMRAFEKSQWFGRGWTLQELLAPSCVKFFDRDWRFIRTRYSDGYDDRSLATISVAEKFSWISTRITSRLEDRAYCLMGLFDVNMPLLYGEGYKAFRRLQLEILRTMNDESVFIWDRPVGWPWARNKLALSSLFGLLATQTTDFGPLLSLRNENHYGGKHRKVHGISRPAYTITNQGLELLVPKRLALKSEFFLPLNYRWSQGNEVRGVYAIILRKVEFLGYHGWHRSIPASLPETLPRLPAVEYEGGLSLGLFIAPENWLWGRDQLAEMED